MMDASKLRETLRMCGVMVKTLAKREQEARQLTHRLASGPSLVDAYQLERDWGSHRQRAARQLGHLVQCSRCPAMLLPDSKALDPREVGRCDKVWDHNGEHAWSTTQDYDWEPKL